MTDFNSGIYSINVGKAVDMLSNAYVSLIKSKKPFKCFPSVMLWGPPGVGKSQCVKEIASIIEAKTHKRAIITDVRLLLFNPVDLRGIPTANSDKTLAVWLKPKIFQMDESDETVNILFLDEISAASPSVQAAAYQMTLDRTVGEHKLPENCIVIAAGNRVTDKSVAYSMPKALANRMCHLEIGVDGDAWHDWAISNRLHPYVVGYLEYNTTALMKFDASGIGLAFPTPRSWEMVSNILRSISEDIGAIYPLISGCIGSSTASELAEWASLYRGMPSVEDIFLGKGNEIPKASELLIALRSTMVEYARSNPVKELIDNSVEYACRLPWEFRGKLLHDYCCASEIAPIIQKNETYKTALENGLK